MGDFYPFFKAYDIRARVPDELDHDMAYRIGRAFAARLDAETVVVGRDMRLSSPGLADALAAGLTEGGADVLDIGLCGTEEVYYATFSATFDGRRADGGVMVTASHNPRDYNGMKFVREDARPISADSGLFEIERMVHDNRFPAAARAGERRALDHRPGYIDFLMGQVEPAKMKPLKIVANPGNGCAGLVMAELEKRLPFAVTRLHFEPDGELPNGVPNPLLPENRAVTADAVRAAGADLGVAWDGDGDRCFLFDERGEYVEGYYIVGLIARMLLALHPGAKIVHDPRLTWNTIDIVEDAGGVPVQSKAGHSFMKERMRAEDAIYGGEMSAHHYFRDFAYCDNGHLPWLFVARLMSETGKPLSELVDERVAKYPASGEINREIADPDAALAAAEARYAPNARRIEHVDGLSMEFDDWRFNLRKSNTEPVVRLNVESRADPGLMRARTDELLEFLRTGHA